MRNRIKLNGLNKRLVSVHNNGVLFTEEHEIDGRIVTNIHFDNGKWVTVAHSLDEVEALFNDYENKESEELTKKWREQAKQKMLLRKQMDDAIREMESQGVKMPKPKHIRSEKNPDGSMVVTLVYEPDSVAETESL